MPVPFCRCFSPGVRWAQFWRPLVAGHRSLLSHESKNPSEIPFSRGGNRKGLTGTEWWYFTWRSPKGPKRKFESFSNHGFLGAFAVSLQGGYNFSSKMSFFFPSPCSNTLEVPFPRFSWWLNSWIFGYAPVFGCVNIWLPCILATLARCVRFSHESIVVVIISKNKQWKPPVLRNEWSNEIIDSIWRSNQYW